MDGINVMLIGERQASFIFYTKMGLNAPFNLNLSSQTGLGGVQSHTKVWKRCIERSTREVDISYGNATSRNSHRWVEASLPHQGVALDSHYRCLSFFKRLKYFGQYEMTTDNTEWQEHADKIFELLTGEAETRKQAYGLLDALVDSAAAAGAEGAFGKIFAGVDTADATFQWMRDMMSEMSSWRRGNFRETAPFWPLFEMWLRLYPGKATTLPSHMTCGHMSSVPDFLKKPHSIQNLTILSEVYDLNDIVGVSTIICKKTVDSYPYWAELAELDSTPLRIWIQRRWSNQYDVLRFEEHKGVRSLKVGIGNQFSLYLNELFSTADEYSTQYIQVATPEMSDEEGYITTYLWSQHTPHHFLDMGFCHIVLNEQTNLTIAERATAIHLVIKEEAESELGDAYTGDFIQDLLGEAIFPNLQYFSATLGEYDEGHITINSSVLERCPKLHTVYCTGGTQVEIRLEDSWTLTHPLSNVYSKQDGRRIAYLFSKEHAGTLAEQLIAVSAPAWQFFEAPLSTLQNLRRIHLFEAEEDISALFSLQNVEECTVEQSTYFLDRWIEESFIGDEWYDHVGPDADYYPEAIKEMVQPPKFAKEGKTAHTLIDIQYYHDTNVSDYGVSKVLIQQCLEHCRNRDFPASFTQFLSNGVVLKVGPYCLWSDTTQTIQMKRYTSWGDQYLEEKKSAGGVLNLERVFVGKPNGVQELLPLSFSAIRYNDARVSIETIQGITELREVTVEDPRLVDDAMLLIDLEVLKLGALGLSELPSAIGNMTNLRELYLWDNQLSALPPELAQLVHLKVINISGNPLTEIPDVLFELPALEKVFFRDGTVFFNTHMSDDDRWNGTTIGNALLLDVNAQL